MIKKIKEEIVYKGFQNVIKKIFSDGTEREIRRGYDAVAVALYNNVGMILVKQYRPTVERFTLEIPAGIMDISSETPEETMLRETKEETGLDIEDYKHLVIFHPSIGSSETKIYLYAAKISNKTPKVMTIDDDEVIDAELRTWDDIDNMIKEGSITDVKTILAYHTIYNKQDHYSNTRA